MDELKTELLKNFGSTKQTIFPLLSELDVYFVINYANIIFTLLAPFIRWFLSSYWLHRRPVSIISSLIIQLKYLPPINAVPLLLL